jgi:bacteriorhodopsin
MSAFWPPVVQSNTDIQHVLFAAAARKSALTPIYLLKYLKILLNFPMFVSWPASAQN